MLTLAQKGRTCLQASTEHKHVGTALMLLDKGADVEGSAATISRGLTALQAVLSPFDKDAGKVDVKRIEQSRNTILQALLDAGADISALSSPQGGMTPTSRAVKTERPGLVRWCLLRGPDPNIPSGGTTVHRAAAMYGLYRPS